MSEQGRAMIRTAVAGCMLATVPGLLAGQSIVDGVWGWRRVVPVDTWFGLILILTLTRERARQMVAEALEAVARTVAVQTGFIRFLHRYLQSARGLAAPCQHTSGLSQQAQVVISDVDLKLRARVDAWCISTHFDVRQNSRTQ